MKSVDIRSHALKLSKCGLSSSATCRACAADISFRKMFRMCWWQSSRWTRSSCSFSSSERPSQASPIFSRAISVACSLIISESSRLVFSAVAHVSDMSAPPPASRAKERAAASGPGHGTPGCINRQRRINRLIKSRPRAKHFVSIVLASPAAVPSGER